MMSRKKSLKISMTSLLIFLYLGKAQSTLEATDIETAINIDFLWNPYYSVINDKAPFNPQNFLRRENLVNQAKSSLWFEIYFGQTLEINGNFEIEIDSAGSQNIIENASAGSNDISEIKNAEIRFGQLYLQWHLLENFFIGLGKIPVRNGFSRIYAPMNYNSRSSDFRNRNGQWNVWFSGNFGNLGYSLRYFPVIEFQTDANTRNQTERFFSWLETSIKRQTFSLKFSYFFFDSMETNLIFFVQEKEMYTFNDIYYAAGLGFSWPVLERLTFRGEVLAGNGFDDLKYVKKITKPKKLPQYLSKNPPQYRYAEADLDSTFVKALGGFTVIIPWDIEISLEYYYNGAGYSSSEREKIINAALESGKYHQDPAPQIAGLHKAFLAQSWPNWSIYNVGRHYLFLQLMRRNIANRLDFLNSSILLLSDMSFFNSTELDFTINDNLTLGVKFDFFLFQEKGAFSLSPSQFKTVLSLEYNI